MNVKKEVFNHIQQILQNELNKCNNKLSQNKYTFKRLEEEQTILKRERVTLTQMIYDLNKENNK